MHHGTCSAVFRWLKWLKIWTLRSCGRRTLFLCAAGAVSRSFVGLNARQQDQDTTSSPAVAERPRDASCLSVVSFTSTIRRAQSSVIVILPLQFYRCVQINSVLFSSSWSSMLVVINKDNNNNKKYVLSNSESVQCNFFICTSATWRSSSSKYAAVYEISSKSDDFFTDICRYKDFQNGGRPPSWNCFTTIRDHPRSLYCWSQLPVKFHVNLIYTDLKI